MNRGDGRVDGSRGGKRKMRGEVRKRMDVPLHKLALSMAYHP
jgi:hypothetical protein